MTYNFPPEYDPAEYLKLHEDLRNAEMSLHDLYLHYEQHGKPEGRIGNSIKSRAEFLALLPGNVSILEIGPFYNPVAKGENVKYFDVLTADQLAERAKLHNAPTANIPPHQLCRP